MSGGTLVRSGLNLGTQLYTGNRTGLLTGVGGYVPGGTYLTKNYRVGTHLNTGGYKALTKNVTSYVPQTYTSNLNLKTNVNVGEKHVETKQLKGLTTNLHTSYVPRTYVPQVKTTLNRVVSPVVTPHVNYTKVPSTVVTNTVKSVLPGTLTGSRLYTGLGTNVYGTGTYGLGRSLIGSTARVG